MSSLAQECNSPDSCGSSSQYISSPMRGDPVCRICDEAVCQLLLLCTVLHYMLDLRTGHITDALPAYRVSDRSVHDPLDDTTLEAQYVPCRFQLAPWRITPSFARIWTEQ